MLPLLSRLSVERRLIDIEDESTLTRAQRERRRRELQEDISVPDPDELVDDPLVTPSSVQPLGLQSPWLSSRFAGVALAASWSLGGDCMGRSDDRCHLW